MATRTNTLVDNQIHVDVIVKCKQPGFTTLKDVLSSNNDHWHFQRLVSYKKVKFRIRCEFSNGEPLGFNYKKSLAVFVPGEGEFKNIADNVNVGIENNNEYYDSHAVHQKYAQKLVNAFYEYIMALYD